MKAQPPRLISCGSTDPMTVEELYRAHREQIFLLAFRVLRNEEAAIDAVQETFVRALRSWERFERRSQPLTWLYRIAFNHCVTVLRRARPQASLDGFDHGDAASSRPEALTEAGETGRRLSDALAGLSEEDRQLLCLVADEGLDYAEIAEILSCSVEAVRMRVSRARARLRERLVETEVA